jgi:hypothetical protein
VNRSGNLRFANSRFAVDEDGHVEPGHRPDDLANRSHAVAAAEGRSVTGKDVHGLDDGRRLTGFCSSLASHRETGSASLIPIPAG